MKKECGGWPYLLFLWFERLRQRADADMQVGRKAGEVFETGI